MPSQLNPYLSFRDNAREAMEFYRSVFGGELTMSTFQEFHACEDAAEANKIMHAALTTGNGITIMASDTPNGMAYNPGSSISMALSGNDPEELSGYFQKLSSEGNVEMPLEKAPWGATFGMCTDKFGVRWLVNIETHGG